MNEFSLFNNYKYCPVCKKALPLTYEKDICPVCEENALFNKVREYIRAQDVTEYQVAEEFKIPHHLVKRWIREGRIEYKEAEKPVLESLHCEICGKPISFGNLCQKCYKEKYNTKAGYAPLTASKEKDKMRYLQEDKMKE